MPPRKSGQSRSRAARPATPRLRPAVPHLSASPQPASEPPKPDIAARDRAALAAALDPIITINARGAIQSASDSVRRVLGWMPSELIGRNVSVLMPQPHRSGHDRYLENYQNTGQTNILNRPRRFDALRKDGSVIPIELCVSRAEMPAGAGPLFVGIIRDMSAYAAVEQSRDDERLRSQQLLAEQTAALQTAHVKLRMADRMASIGTLAAGLGHDMNNVLMPVRARLNALKAAGDSGKVPAPERKHIEAIRKSIAYLQQLADGLHFLALDPETAEDARGGGASTDLSKWWQQAGPLLSKAVPKHVRVTASFPPHIPFAAIAAHGLTQAVLNLVVNSGEAIPSPSERKRRQGYVRLLAELVRDGGSDWIRLGVTDNGAGMSDEVKRRAFDMFFTTKPRGLGTGLGLALVRQVVDRVGGKVDIQSEPGKGTTVTILIPAVRPSDSSRRPTSAFSAAVSLQDGRAAALVQHLLEASGCPVRADQDPTQAQIWVIDPARANLKSVKSWRDSNPNASLILFGIPPARSAARWRDIRTINIAHPDDFECIRSAISLAIAEQ